MAETSDESQQSQDERFMRIALEEARLSAQHGEVPIGAVIACNGDILSRAGNSPISYKDPTAHAEMLALRQAAQKIANYRLSGCTLYVTLEPCPMCAGALVHSRVDRLVFGVRDIRFGGVRSKFRIADSELLNHSVQVVEGVLAADCLELLQGFFQERRNKDG